MMGLFLGLFNYLQAVVCIICWWILESKKSVFPIHSFMNFLYLIRHVTSEDLLSYSKHNSM